MKDILIIALPFIIIILSIAIIFANYKKEKETYCSDGMSIGMCLGLVISMVLKMNTGICLSVGMLVGETIGTFIEKKKE